MKECNFWQHVVRQMASQGLSLVTGSFDTAIQLGNHFQVQRILNGSLRPLMLEDVRDQMLKLWPRQYQRLQYLIARNKSLAASILHVTGKSVFVDASKNPAAIRHLSGDAEVDLRVVHLVRDVRGASLSKRTNKGEANWHRAVNSWVRENENIEHQLGRLAADRWIRIRYEDLCHSPETTLNRFFEFCDEEPHKIPDDFMDLEHHIVGNRMRLTSIGQIQLNESWRRVLTSDELDTAARSAGSVHERYGYQRISAADLIGEKQSRLD